MCKAPEAIVIMATLLKLCSKRMIDTVQHLPGMLIWLHCYTTLIERLKEKCSEGSIFYQHFRSVYWGNTTVDVADVWEGDCPVREIISARAQLDSPNVVTIPGEWGGLLRSAWLLSKYSEN